MILFFFNVKEKKKCDKEKKIVRMYVCEGQLVK
jgi:hypothetical protein